MSSNRCQRCYKSTAPGYDLCRDCSCLKSFIITITHKETGIAQSYISIGRDMKSAAEKVKPYIKGQLSNFKASGKVFKDYARR